MGGKEETNTAISPHLQQNNSSRTKVPGSFLTFNFLCPSLSPFLIHGKQRLQLSSYLRCYKAVNAQLNSDQVHF